MHTIQDLGTPNGSKAVSWSPPSSPIAVSPAHPQEAPPSQGAAPKPTHDLPVSLQILETCPYDFCNIVILYNYVQKKTKFKKKKKRALQASSWELLLLLTSLRRPHLGRPGGLGQLRGKQPGTCRSLEKPRAPLPPSAPPRGHQRQALRAHQPYGQDTSNFMASSAILHSEPTFKSVCDTSFEIFFFFF